MILKFNARVTRIVIDEDTDYATVSLFLYELGIVFNVPWANEEIPIPKLGSLCLLTVGELGERGSAN